MTKEKVKTVYVQEPINPKPTVPKLVRPHKLHSVRSWRMIPLTEGWVPEDAVPIPEKPARTIRGQGSVPAPIRRTPRVLSHQAIPTQPRLETGVGAAVGRALRRFFKKQDGLNFDVKAVPTPTPRQVGTCASCRHADWVKDQDGKKLIRCGLTSTPKGRNDSCPMWIGFGPSGGEARRRGGHV